VKPYLVVFVSVFLAEVGDKTQLATMFFATDSTLSRSGVLAAAAGALVASSIIAVAVGSVMGAWVQPRALQTVAALGFIAIGVWMLVRG
jgi:putative Ca2+/H+ antiporter (TMEM165/GDT1 family)